MPAFLAAPAAKLAAVLGLVTVLTLGYFGWREYQQYIGYQECHEDQLADLLKQQQEATGHYIVREAMKLKTVERSMAEKDRLHAKLRQSYQEVVRLENDRQPKEAEDVQHDTTTVEARLDCPVAPDLVRTVNGLARVLNDTAEEREAAAGGAAAQPALSGAGAAP
jgi:predicted SPOUT superfamily RNA methylase MTH1